MRGELQASARLTDRLSGLRESKKFPNSQTKTVHAYRFSDGRRWRWPMPDNRPQMLEDFIAVLLLSRRTTNRCRESTNFLRRIQRQKSAFGSPSAEGPRSDFGCRFNKAGENRWGKRNRKILGRHLPNLPIPFRTGCEGGIPVDLNRGRATCA